jgi:hypothetical protein
MGHLFLANGAGRGRGKSNIIDCLADIKTKLLNKGVSIACCSVPNSFILLLEIWRYKKLEKVLPHHFIPSCK